MERLKLALTRLLAKGRAMFRPHIISSSVYVPMGPDTTSKPVAAQQEGGYVKGTHIKKIIAERQAPLSIERLSQPLAPGSSLKIAVLDDNAAILEFLETMLVMDGHKVTRYVTGAALLNALLGPERQIGVDGRCPYDLVILDLLLPGKYSGADVFLAIRAEFPLEELPIIVITAVDEPTLVQFRRILPDDVPLLRKPFQPRLLRQMIAHLMSYKKTP